jgi:hypothetical protein
VRATAVLTRQAPTEKVWAAIPRGEDAGALHAAALPVNCTYGAAA